MPYLSLDTGVYLPLADGCGMCPDATATSKVRFMFPGGREELSLPCPLQDYPEPAGWK